MNTYTIDVSWMVEVPDVIEVEADDEHDAERFAFDIIAGMSPDMENGIIIDNGRIMRIEEKT
jgi:hypothetical protein|tara:strand:+ start:36526 stop:36711 length:186 start_codon:yes stop_codon:yes gene_type:complete